MKKRILVIGAGRFGVSVVKELYHLKNEVIAIDTNEKLLQELNDYVVYSVVGDAKNDNVLADLDIPQFDATIVAIGNSFESSILITKKLKDLKCKFIISKASNQQMGEILSAVGADEIVYPEKEAGIRTAKKLSFRGIIEYIEINEEVSGIELEVPAAFHDMSLSDIRFSKKYSLTVALIIRNKKPLLNNIALEVFKPGDQFLIVGDNKKINAFRDKYHR